MIQINFSKMKCPILTKATEMFLSLGFKSVTMDDIACEMCISKKTIYKYFCNKELLIAETTDAITHTIYSTIDEIVAKKHNAIKENFEIVKMIKEMFVSIETSPSYQLKKHYPEIHNEFICREVDECNAVFRQNIAKGIKEGLYRENIDIEKINRSLINTNSKKTDTALKPCVTKLVRFIFEDPE